MAVVIAAARGEADLVDVKALFQDYAASLEIDLGYQGFEAELAGLPGRYAPPAGEILIARGEGGEALGCVAFRPLDPPATCEIKRLYVRPQGRGTGAGRALIGALLQAASAAGYGAARLDTLPSMGPAIALYRSLGFSDVAPYWDSIPGTLFLGRNLQPA